MRSWLKPLEETLARGEAAMLVHLAELKGSAPREAGAAMLVTETAIVDTIGGGEMERTAIQKARELLHKGGAAFLRLSLGPDLNQCCGGSVTIAFEPFAPADLAWLRKLIRARGRADAGHAHAFDRRKREFPPRLVDRVKRGTGLRRGDRRCAA